MTLPPLRLKRHEDRRLRAGHAWVFSNEVDIAATPLTAFEPGDAVAIQSHDGRTLGTGYVNPHALICARIVSRDPEIALGKSLLVHRINVARGLRERLYAAPFYRLLFGESDETPGLVVDRYGEVCVVQTNTAGMERHKDAVVAALTQALKPACIVFRNDGASRALEGLPAYVEVAAGRLPDEIVVDENGARFLVPVQAGQKTGWFYDQRANRTRARAYVGGKRVLDLFSYLGAWGVQAAHAGAAEVVCVDASAQALEWARDNAARNDVGDRVRGVQADAFDALRELRAARERFDVVIADPPAFVKRKKDVDAGERAYHRLNQMALQVLAKDGILVSASCSYHLAAERLRAIVLDAGRHLDRFLQIVEQGHQAPDHPVHPAIPETEYLKCLFVRALPAR